MQPGAGINLEKRFKHTDLVDPVAPDRRLARHPSLPPYVPKELRHKSDATREATTKSVAFAVPPKSDNQVDSRLQGGLAPSVTSPRASAPQPVVAGPRGSHIAVDSGVKCPVANAAQSRVIAKAESRQFGSSAKVDKSLRGLVTNLSHLSGAEAVDLSFLLSQFAEDKVLSPAVIKTADLPETLDEPKRPEGPSILEDSPTKKRRSNYQNDDRWTQMDSADAELIGKLGGYYLSSDPNSFMPETIWGPSSVVLADHHSRGLFRR
jgi:hypothetical protein